MSLCQSSFAPRPKLALGAVAALCAISLCPGEAKAILTYNIFESGGNVVVQANGSLNLAGASSLGEAKCNVNGVIISASAILCTGSGSRNFSKWAISGPNAFNGTVSRSGGASVLGVPTQLFSEVNAQGFIGIDKFYDSGTPIISSATFSGYTLSTIGFTQSSGLLGTWTLNGTSESIQIVLGDSTAVPGPLPLFGAAAAFGWSRKLRRRIATPLITAPQD